MQSRNKEKVRENNQWEERFVNDVSHELRTPLTIIRGYIEILERYGAQDAELFQEAVTSIKNSAANMQNLVESLLFLARAEAGNQALNKVRVDLDDLLRRLVAEYGNERVQIAKLEACKIMADTEFYKKMLWAFLDNAVSYSAPDTAVKVELRATMGEATLKVIDKGIGIAKEDLPKIFERFYRTDKSRTNLGRGASSVGLGLSVAKWIADQHEIKIEVKSKIGTGSEFKLIIPTLKPK